MSEKIKLLELDIDIDALTKNSAEVLQEFESLKDKQKDLKKATTELKKEINSYNQALKDPNVKNNTALVTKLKTALEATKKEYQETTKAQATNKSEIKAASKEYNLSLKMLDAYAEKQRTSIVAITQTDGSIDQLSAALAKNRAAYRSLSKDQRENSDVGQKLSKIISEQDAEYKKLNKGMGVNQVEVGNYREEMKAAIKETSGFSRVQSELMGILSPFVPLLKMIDKQWTSSIKAYRNSTTEIKAETQAQKAWTIAKNIGIATLKLLRAAVISTGIGALVIVIIALVSWFKKTQVGADKLQQILAQIGAVIDVIVDRFSKIGGIIVKLVTGQTSLNDAWKESKEALSGMGDEMEREIRMAKELKKIEQDLEKQQLLLNFQRSAANTKIKELNKTVEDTSKSYQERLKAAKEIEKIETELADKELKNAQQSLALALGKKEVDQEAIDLLQQLKDGTIEYEDVQNSLGLSESTIDDVKKLLEAFDKAESAQQRSLEVRTTNQNKINTIQKAAANEAITNAKKVTDAAIKESKTRLDIYIAENDGKAKTLEDKLAFEQSIYDRSVDIYKKQLKAKQISHSEYDLIMIETQNDFLHRQSEIATEHAQDDLDIYIANHKSKLESDKLLSDESVAQEEARLQAIYEKQLEFYQLQKDQGLLNDTDYNLQKIQLQEEYLNNSKAINDQFDAQKAEQRATEWEQDLELKRLQGDSEYQIQLAQLDREHKANREAAIKNGTWSVKAEQIYAAKRKKITDAEQASKRQAYADTFGNLASILGKETAAGKAAAVAQATINTYQAATAAFSSMASIPVVGPALGAIAAAAAIVAGIKNVQKIVSTDTSIPKAEHGAVFDIGGNRHSAGGTKFFGEDGTVFEAEKDEKLIIMNRAASAAIGGLSNINQAHGGKSLFSTSSYLADGGAVARSIGAQQSITKIDTKQMNIDYDLLAQKVADANRSLPNPITKVQDIITEVDRFNEVVNEANR